MQGPHAPAPRPPGELVWIHVEDAAAARALPALARQIREESREVRFLATGEARPPETLGEPVPAERPQAVEAFVARCGPTRWSIWAGRGAPSFWGPRRRRCR